MVTHAIAVITDAPATVRGVSMNSRPADRTRWTIHGERVVDETRRLRLSIASVELPDGVCFEQYVLRMPKAAIAVVVQDDSVLMIYRHRFIVDRWVWELPGGYVDPGEEPALTAAREVEEETGWRPHQIEPFGSFQALSGIADFENLLFLSQGASYVGDPVDINEAERVDWIPLGDVARRIANGEIPGAGAQLALFKLLTLSSS
jgi:8-oxo-dGTP pyrophosphatase MutT (NUDIX family)